MQPVDSALAYAQEVYAACATVGFDNEQTSRLKRMVDERAAGAISGTDADLVATAQAAHLAAVAWATRS